MAASLFTQVFNFTADYFEDCDVKELISADDVATVCEYASFDEDKEDIENAPEDWNLMQDVAKALNEKFALV